MSDVMFFGVLRMPYEMAMADDLSRYQFYTRAQEAADRVEKAERELAKRAVSPAESVQSIDTPEFMELLNDFGVANQPMSLESDWNTTRACLIAHIDASRAAAYERGYDDGHIAGRDKGKRASTEEAHAEGRCSALEELEAKIEAAARDKDGNHVDDLRGWLDEAREENEVQGVAFHACSLKLKQAAEELAKEKERADRAEAQLTSATDEGYLRGAQEQSEKDDCLLEDLKRRLEAAELEAKSDRAAFFAALRLLSSTAQPLQQEGGKDERHTMTEMQFDDGHIGWYYDAGGVYIDVEKDAEGNLSVFVRDRNTEKTGWLDQADNLQQASTAQVEPAPVGCPDLGDAEDFAEMLTGHGGMLTQAIEMVDGCMNETMVEPEDAAAWQIVKKHIRPAQATPIDRDAVATVQQKLDSLTVYGKPNAQATPEGAELPPAEYDTEMDRHYLPLPNGWEVQTKGNGSTFRIAHVPTGARYMVLDEDLHEPLTDLANDVRAALAASQQATEPDWRMIAEGHALNASALQEELDALKAALQGLLDRYVGLVASGDAGNWDAEKDSEVIAARAALAGRAAPPQQADTSGLPG